MAHICEDGVCHIVPDEEPTPKKETIQLNDDERTPCEIWTRVMGYHRPISSWNKGKRSEHKERKYYREDVTLNSLDRYAKKEEAGNA